MSKKEPKEVLEELVGKLAAKPALTEFQRRETPDQAAVEWVHSDVKNPFELSMGATANSDVVARVRFPLTQTLTDQQIDQTASDILKLAAGVDGSLACDQNRLVLTYNMSPVTDRDGKSLNTVINHGMGHSSGLRTILDKTFGLPTDPGSEKWYQYKLGMPVKLSAAEMNALQGGRQEGLSVLAAGLGGLIGAGWGAIPVGYAAYVLESPSSIPTFTAPPTSYSSPPPFYKTYCFARSTLVHTARGVVMMADLVEGDQIRVGEQTTTVLGLDRHEGQFEMVEIITSRGSIVSTADHPFFHNGQWVQAADLKSVDRSGQILAVRGASTLTEVFNVRTASGLYTVGDCQLVVSGLTQAAARAAA
jgi:hypothetical protein